MEYLADDPVHVDVLGGEKIHNVLEYWSRQAHSNLAQSKLAKSALAFLTASDMSSNDFNILLH